MKILIVAPENDNHTAPLKWALGRAGFSAACWPGLGWAGTRQASILLSNDNRIQLGDQILEAGDVVWVRRPDPPKFNPHTASEDHKFAVAEYRWFFQSVMYLLETLPVRCVNKYSASRFINNKSVQLLLARSCGMKAPATLMTNSPEAVRKYFRQSSTRTICKAFFPHIWRKQTQSSVAVTETFELAEEMLPEDEVLTYAPAIYQEMVVKRFDVRMVVLGRAVYSYALHNPTGALDWRQDAGQGLVEVQLIDTPPEIEQSVLAFAARAQIAYGSFDFAVDDHGTWWFLEVNEGGQFLWLDDFNANIHVQEKFLAFLTSPEGSSKEYLERRQALFPSWKDYLDCPAREEQAPEDADSEAAFVSMEA
jgi:glutathione synthase/RimK-type ligase-like ATP-grasp enzyme